MTPKKKTSTSTTLMMERKLINQVASSGGTLHIAGGSNAGIVVNKQTAENDDGLPAHLCLEFRVFLINASTKKYTQEKRIISYWFKDQFPVGERTHSAQEFFKDLVSPVDFPRDYVGFIKKIMKLMQNQYPMIAKIEVQLTQEKEMDHLPNQPSDKEKQRQAEVKVENVLEAIEQSYPNSLTIDDLCNRFKLRTEVIRNMVLQLVEKHLVKSVGAGVPGAGDLDPAAGAFRRVHQNEDEVTIVKQMPRSVERAMQPTIAVITSQYFEKMAVDAVMTNKQTFMRYATVGGGTKRTAVHDSPTNTIRYGEANVYTLGDVGSHRVVTTKLPMMTGDTRNATIATGSTTTRLLGTFQGVEHVFLVGCGGAVPHYTDFGKHVRLGDVVASAPAQEGQKFIYQYCESAREKDNGEVQFETRSWCPPDLTLQDIAARLQEQSTTNTTPFLSHFRDALTEICDAGASELAWTRPSAETDKLYMSVGGGDVIEVGHPTPRDGEVDPRLNGEPMLHLGPVATGRAVTSDDRLRQEFASRHGIRAFDAELDAVVESIYGNRKDQYMLIRGISDYQDGTTNKDWQLYASLMAAATLRAIVERMDPPAL